MKQKLTNSLILLSEAVEELSRNFSLYKNFKIASATMTDEESKLERSELNNKINELKQSIMYEKDKNTRALEEIKELSVELKNSSI